jgi:hypothetical protein
MAIKSMSGSFTNGIDTYETPSLAFGFPTSAARDKNSALQSLVKDFSRPETLPWANWRSYNPESTTEDVTDSTGYPLRDLYYNDRTAT